MDWRIILAVLLGIDIIINLIVMFKSGKLKLMVDELKEEYSKNRMFDKKGDFYKVSDFGKAIINEVVRKDISKLDGNIEKFYDELLSIIRAICPHDDGIEWKEEDSIIFKHCAICGEILDVGETDSKKGLNLFSEIISQAKDLVEKRKVEELKEDASQVS